MNMTISAGGYLRQPIHPSAVVTKYAYDGAQVIAEYDGTDTLLRKFIYGPGRGAIG